MWTQAVRTACADAVAVGELDQCRSSSKFTDCCDCTHYVIFHCIFDLITFITNWVTHFAFRTTLHTWRYVVSLVCVCLLTPWSSWSLASPAMGHWGTCPHRLPASYFGDHSLYRLWRVMSSVFCPAENFKRTNTENVQKQRDFCEFFKSIFGPFLSFVCPQFSSGSNYSSQNAGKIANKFQLHTYFRFR